jgi:RNA polymerase sigma-70 factor (ECF subfamily)
MEPTDEELLTRARSDGAAFEAFYRRHVDAVTGYFMRRTADPEVAADLMAETFAAVLVSLRRYRPGPEPPTAWLFGIARNKLAHWQRRQGVESRARRRLGVGRVELDDEDLAAIEALADAQRAEAVVQAELSRLPEEQRLAIAAHVLDERGYADIAREQGVSEPVVRQRVSRGLRRMRARMEDRT